MALGREAITTAYKTLQDSICTAISEADGKGEFASEIWERPGGGVGDTRVIENGAVIEKGGVNFSAVHGALPPKIATALKASSEEFFATGVSIVMHPENPFVPIIHMNIRYFEMDNGTWWFGGGIDLTPHYINQGEATWFHNQLKETCDQYDLEYYARFKNWADEYFYVRHRKESRGVSGIFFDRLNEDAEKKSKEALFKFQLAIGEFFAPIYTRLMTDNKNKEYTNLNKAWQMHRRSRYVEFNLLHDKGTKFGLDTDGRIDSILMSLPPSTGWPYTQSWPENGPEMKTQKILETLYLPM